MNTTYAAQADRFTTTVSAVPDWDAPSPCEGWTVADVVEHVVTTQRDFLGQHADLGSLPSTTDPVARWRAHDAKVREVLPALVDVAYDGHFGPTTVGQTMATFYGFDLVVHRWDIARGTGLDESMTEDELGLLEGMVPASATTSTPRASAVLRSTSPTTPTVRHVPSPCSVEPPEGATSPVRAAAPEPEQPAESSSNSPLPTQWRPATRLRQSRAHDEQ